MLRVSSIVMLCVLILVASPAVSEEAENGGSASPWVISSGAFTGLPPGSLVSVAVALERGIPAIKLDLVLSADDQVMVLSDPRLNDITNVDEVYPDRARDDGSYYSVDLTRAEIKELTHRTAGSSDSLAGIGAVFKPEFPVMSLDEIFGYVDMIHADPARKPVVVCELRKGWLHRREGKDPAPKVFSLLQDYIQRSGKAVLFLASYDPEELQQLAELKGTVDDDPKFIQLIATSDGTEVRTLDFGQYQPYNYDLLFTKFGLKAISTYAAAIGLHPQTIFDESGALTRQAYLEDATTLGMQLILYGEPPLVPQLHNAEGEPATSVLDRLFTTAGFDAVLTDNTDLVSSWRQQTEKDTGEHHQDTTIERLIKRIESGSTEQPSSSQSGATW